MIARVGLDYTAALTQTAGIGRYARDLSYGLIGARHDWDWRLLAIGQAGKGPAGPEGASLHPTYISEKNINRAWHRLRIPWPVEAWMGRIDLFHSLDFNLAYTLPGVKTVLTIHDLVYERHPESTMPGMLNYLKTTVPHSARRADHIITPSESARRDVIGLYGIPPDRVTAVHHGIDPRFRPDTGYGEEAFIRTKYNLPPGPLVLTVGTMQPRKNHATLVRAFSRVRRDATLVIAGGEGWGYEKVLEETNLLRQQDRVRFTGFVDDIDLPALYRTSALVAYPALYEGFGFPVLEAMACGVPVVTSTTSSLPEVLGADGEAGYLVDPLDVNGLSEAIERVLSFPEEMRVAMGAKGWNRAKEFTWKKAAEKTLSVYEKLLAE